MGAVLLTNRRLALRGQRAQSVAGGDTSSCLCCGACCSCPEGGSACQFVPPLERSARLRVDQFTQNGSVYRGGVGAHQRVIFNATNPAAKPAWTWDAPPLAPCESGSPVGGFTGGEVSRVGWSCVSDCSACNNQGGNLQDYGLLSLTVNRSSCAPPVGGFPGGPRVTSFSLTLVELSWWQNGLLGDILECGFQGNPHFPFVASITVWGEADLTDPAGRRFDTFAEVRFEWTSNYMPQGPRGVTISSTTNYPSSVGFTQPSGGGDFAGLLNTTFANPFARQEDACASELNIRCSWRAECDALDRFLSASVVKHFDLSGFLNMTFELDGLEACP